MTMTFEKRIERLAERQEALAQSIQFMAHRLDAIVAASNREAEHIRALLIIAEGRQ